MIRRPPRSTLFPYTTALPISHILPYRRSPSRRGPLGRPCRSLRLRRSDRKSTRLNSSHGYISYAVFCLKKKADDLRVLVRKQLSDPVAKPWIELTQWAYGLIS